MKYFVAARMHLLLVVPWCLLFFVWAPDYSCPAFDAGVDAFVCSLLCRINSARDRLLELFCCRSASAVIPGRAFAADVIVMYGQLNLMKSGINSKGPQTPHVARVPLSPQSFKVDVSNPPGIGLVSATFGQK